jgi:hypothetical protein
MRQDITPDVICKFECWWYVFIAFLSCIKLCLVMLYRQRRKRM